MIALSEFMFVDFSKFLFWNKDELSKDEVRSFSFGTWRLLSSGLIFLSDLSMILDDVELSRAYFLSFSQVDNSD